MMFFHTASWESENGMSLAMGTSSHILSGITDLLSAESQIVKAPGQDGATTYDTTLGQRTVTVTFSIHSYATDYDTMLRQLESMEDYINRAFAPNRFGVLTDNRVNGSRRIRARPVDKPIPGVRVQNSKSFTVDLISDLPLWEKTSETVYELGRETGAFRFPLKLPTPMGYYIKEAVITNDTHIDIYPIIEIYTTSAFVAITNDRTGQKTQIDRPILRDQKMVIDNANTQASIWERGASDIWTLKEDVSHWLSLDSEWWALIQGENPITLRNERQGESLIATIRYHEPI